MTVNLHWRDLEKPTVPSEWQGLELTVQGAARAGFTVSVCPPSCIRIATSTTPLVWARIYDDYYGYELLRSSQRGSPGIIAPISFRTVEENSRGDRAAFYRAWARTYGKMLAHSASSPLFEGRWYLGHDRQQSSHRGLAIDVLRRVVRQHLHGHVPWGTEAAYPIALRKLSSSDDGRVHAWRKHARAGSLPPVILYWISGLCAHVVLDGHDRALAASLENVPAPVLFLEALREHDAHAGKDAVFEAVARALPAGESPSLPVESANRLLLDAFAPGLVTAPTRATVLSGGVAAWSLEVRRELALQQLEDSTLLDGLRGQKSDLPR